MEDQLGALGLVVNAIVLWNTRFMGVVLTELCRAGELVLENVARLTPLLHENVNMLGRYLHPAGRDRPGPALTMA